MTIAAVAWKEFRQISRDVRTLFTLLFLPALLLLLYGYALNWDIRHVRFAVDDRDHSPESRAVVAAFANSGYFDLVGSASDRTIDDLMDHNSVRAVLVIPSDFSRSLRTGRTAPVQVLLNGDNANTATTVMGYSLTILQNESSKYMLSSAGRPATPLVTVEPRVWYNPELRSTLFLIPGLIAYIVMITAVISTAVSVVREKERGTIEQVRMAPIGPLSFVVGKTIPYFVISLAAALAIVAVSMLLFELPMRGSWITLLLTTSLFLFGALGLGLLISTVAETQQVAFQMAMLASFLPSFLLSGFIFPIASMPAFLRAVTYAIPARYYLTALRAIVLKGSGVRLFWVDLAALGLLTVILLGLASVRLKREWA